MIWPDTCSRGRRFEMKPSPEHCPRKCGNMIKSMVSDKRRRFPGGLRLTARHLAHGGVARLARGSRGRPGLVWEGLAVQTQRVVSWVDPGRHVAWEHPEVRSNGKCVLIWPRIGAAMFCEQEGHPKRSLGHSSRGRRAGLGFDGTSCGVAQHRVARDHIGTGFAQLGLVWTNCVGRCRSGCGRCRPNVVGGHRG